MGCINEGRLIPTISNAVTNDVIFDIDGGGILGISADEPSENEDVTDLSIEEQLARAWANEIGFPLPGDHLMARVALYYSVTTTSVLAAKTEYLRWLKDELLLQTEFDDDVDESTIEELEEDIDQPFSMIVNRLGYPKSVTGRRDPLDLLAKLRLPIYITTSPFDFLERALMANKVTPRTQVCFWNGTPPTLNDPQHATDHHYPPKHQHLRQRQRHYDQLKTFQELQQQRLHLHLSPRQYSTGKQSANPSTVVI